MKIQLLVATWSPSCRRAQQVWRQLAQDHGLELSVVDVDEPAGQSLMQRLQLNTIPALLIDERLVAVGVQSQEEAEKIVRAAGTPPRGG